MAGVPTALAIAHASATGGTGSGSGTAGARAAGVAWRGPIKAESIIRQADVLLSEAGAEVNVQGAAPQVIESMTEL